MPAATPLTEAQRNNRWLEQLTVAIKDGRPVSDLERIATFRSFIESGRLETIEPLLPLLLNLKGKPCTLDDHFVFAPMFRTRMSQKLVIKAGRQVAKSTSQASSAVVMSNSIPNHTTLFITPLFEQIRKFSANYVGDFINQSPVKRLWSDTTTNNSVLQRSFKNQSKLIFGFALDSPDRLRGISTDVCSFDEIQDHEREFVPIIEESMSYSKWEVSRYTGTPKTVDNTLERLWERSSKAEWVMKCPACNYENVPANTHDLQAMIGPWHADISEARPATICAKCKKPISPRVGRWMHTHKEKRWTFAGYHVPQILMPLHYANKTKWSSLLTKREQWAPNVFNNEVLGESYDTGAMLVTETDLKKAAILPWENNHDNPDPTMLARLPEYSTRVLAIDWGGGGKEGVSYTTLALLCWRSDGVIDVVWGRRLRTPHDHVAEAVEVRNAIQQFHPHFLVHDYSGAGTVRETVLVQAGISVEKIMAVAYVGIGHTPFKYIKATATHPRNHYQANKTRTLLTTTTAIKFARVRFFAYDYKSDESPGLMADFLALLDEKVDTTKGSMYKIFRKEGFSDDFAQAVNIGCASLWHINDAWPDIAAMAGINAQPSNEQLIAAFGGQELDWGDQFDNFIGRP